MDPYGIRPSLKLRNVILLAVVENFLIIQRIQPLVLS